MAVGGAMSMVAVFFGFLDSTLSDLSSAHTYDVPPLNVVSAVDISERLKDDIA